MENKRRDRVYGVPERDASVDTTVLADEVRCFASMSSVLADTSAGAYVPLRLLTRCYDDSTNATLPGLVNTRLCCISTV